MSKVILLSLMLSTVSLALFGQVKPRWTQTSEREINYPQQSYFTGYIEGNLRQDETVEDAKLRLMRDAQGLLIESIRVRMKSQSTLWTESTETKFKSLFESKIQTESDIEIVGIKTEPPYYNQGTGIIHAFAYLKRSDYVDYLKNSLNKNLTQAEGLFQTANDFVKSGKKISALNKCEEAKKILLNSVEYYQNMLIIVNAGADEGTLQLSRSNNLLNAIEKALINLRQIISIYLNCEYEYKGNKHDAFDSDPNIICDIIAHALSEKNCSITDNIDEADYELKLITSTYQRSDGKSQYGVISYYANVKGSLYNSQTNKKTADFVIFNDPDAYAVGRSAEDAATKAFKLPWLKNKILETILPRLED